MEAEAKQLEQKRRNDERKAKARAEREQRSKTTRSSVVALAGTPSTDASPSANSLNNKRTESMDMTSVDHQSLAGLDSTAITTITESSNNHDYALALGEGTAVVSSGQHPLSDNPSAEVPEHSSAGPSVEGTANEAPFAEPEVAPAEPDVAPAEPETAAEPEVIAASKAAAEPEPIIVQPVEKQEEL
eukprot:GILJ01025943.1.p1 GENE.GILJ01025943.1~~GILJ01025943.1.p1  ORF type:complete len:187 (-),score=45.79 GILJ01025943.1:14-574(-)